MSLSATRSRRSNAGNRWAEALAAALLENGTAPDPDAEMSGEEFVGKEEEDVFESDFESTDEEEYAKEGAQDEEKQLLAEEWAERRASRAKATKSAAMPAQRLLERAIRGQPVEKKQKVAKKAHSERNGRKGNSDDVLWDATRQSRRTSTVKHKVLVRERLKDAEARKAHATKRPRRVAVTKTQDELIAEALELEEKNTKSLQEFLVKEEEKRAAARRVVRMKIEGPKIRWISRAEDVRMRIEGVTPAPVIGNNSCLGSSVSPAANPAALPKPDGSLRQPGRSPLSQSATLPQPDTSQTMVQETSTPLNDRASGTPAPSKPGRRMEMYIELPRRSISSSQLPLHSASSRPLPSISISEPLSRPSSKAPSPSVPRAPSLVRSVSGHSVKSASPVDTLNPNRPNTIRQGSVSSTSSNRSRMMMCVELPAPKYEKRTTPVPPLSAPPTTSAVPVTLANPLTSIASATHPTCTREDKATEGEATSKPILRASDNDIFPPGGPNFAIVLPQRKHVAVSHRKERYMKNYIVVELSGKDRSSFGARMRAIFGDHADWSDVLLTGFKSSRSRTTPVCAITGLNAPYRDPRTGIPYANAYAYKTLTRLLQHEFIWSQEKGCYVGDEGKNAARGVPWNWSVAAMGRPPQNC